jgi:hypothetical protein
MRREGSDSDQRKGDHRASSKSFGPITLLPETESVSAEGKKTAIKNQYREMQKAEKKKFSEDGTRDEGKKNQ